MKNDVLILDRLPSYVQDAITRGTPRRVRCPKCDGGSSHEDSLSIRSVDDGIVKLSCWRATCGWWATTITDPGAQIHTKLVKPARYFDEDTGPVYGLEDILVGDYGINIDLVADRGWRMGVGGKLVIPILDQHGRETGHITRTFDTNKRVMTYKATAAPFLDWWAPHSPVDKTVIVEDCLSAARLCGLGFHSIALLGTSISAEQAQLIRQWCSTSEIWIALDRDAFTKSLSLCRRHRHIIKMLPVCLDEDIKNMDRDADIRELFGVRHGRDVTRCSSLREQESL